MNKSRSLEILRKVLEFEYEELADENHKLWAMDMFDISAEEYDEIFGEPKKEVLFMVEEQGRSIHEGEFNTFFGLYDNLESALVRYNQERDDVLNGDCFFMREEVKNGDLIESETISSNGIHLPLLSIESDEEFYELYICEVEKGN